MTLELSFPEQLQIFANKLTNGYLKTGKANSMVMTYAHHMTKSSDEDKLDWVKNCLLMEGFYESDCVLICDFMKEHLDYAT